MQPGGMKAAILAPVAAVAAHRRTGNKIHFRHTKVCGHGEGSPRDGGQWASRHMRCKCPLKNDRERGKRDFTTRGIRNRGYGQGRGRSADGGRTARSDRGCTHSTLSESYLLGTSTRTSWARPETPTAPGRTLEASTNNLPDITSGPTLPYRGPLGA